MTTMTATRTAVSVTGLRKSFGDKVVLASRLQFGTIWPVGGDQANVPFSKKYFLGGAASLRGWGRYEVSPLSGSGLPIGGDSLVSFSEELRAGHDVAWNTYLPRLAIAAAGGDPGPDPHA